MCGSDTFCAFCGALAAKPYIAEDEADPEWTYDPDIIQPEDLEWMNDVVLITEDRDTASVKDRHVLPGQSFDVN